MAKFGRKQFFPMAVPILGLNFFFIPLYPICSQSVSCIALDRGKTPLQPYYNIINDLFLPLMTVQKDHLGSLKQEPKRKFVNDVKDYLLALDCKLTDFVCPPVAVCWKI